MKNLTKKQIANLNKLVNINNSFIGTSVANISKNKASLVAEVLCHTLTETTSLFITITRNNQVVAINGSHSHSMVQFKGNVTLN